jgi:predicted metal-dependent phosphotriesterase family hydrolase
MEDLKLWNGSDAIRPKMGDIVELPREIAQAEIKAGFVKPIGDEEDTSNEEKPLRKAKKPQLKKALEEDDE